MPNLLDAPVPGQSLTREPKSSRMEQPPHFVELDKALVYVFDKFTDPKKATDIVLLLKQGVSCEYLARTFLTAGLFEGMWTVDLMLPMADKVMYMIASIGKVAGVKDIKMKNPDKKRTEFLAQFAKGMDVPAVEKKTDSISNDLFSGLGA